MANFFDQFDQPQQPSGGNYFDRFDQAMPSSASAPFPLGKVMAPAGQFLATAGAHALGGLVGPVGQELGPSAPLRQRMDQLLTRAGGPSSSVTPEQAAATPDAQTVSQGALKAMGTPEYQPSTMAGRVGMGATTAGMMGLTNPSSLPSAILSGAGSEAAGQLAPQNRAAQFWARLAGGVPGTAAGSVASSVLTPQGATTNPLTGKTIPGRVDPETAQLGQAAMDNGVPINVAQLSNNPFIRRAYNWTKNLPFSGAAAGEQAQQEGLAKWLGSSFGEPNAKKLTTDVFIRAGDRIGSGLDDYGTRTGALIDTPQLTKLANIESSALGSLTEGEFKPISVQLNNVFGKVGPGNMISGSDYQSLTRYGTPLGDALRSSNPNIRFYARQIRDVLDEGLEAASTPADVAGIRGLRTQWRNMLTWEPLTMRADTLGGATPSTGIISPAAMLGQVRNVYGDRPSTYGPAGQQALEQARVGQRFLKEPTTSGTAENAGISGLLGHGGGVAAMGLGAHEAGVPLHYLAATLPAYLATGAGVNAALRNQMLARLQVRSGLNPDAARLTGFPPSSIPFALAPGASQGVPLQ